MGGAKYVRARTSQAQSPLRPGALDALWVFDALSCYLSLILKHSDTKWGFFFFFLQILGGYIPVALPSKSATDVYCVERVLGR